MAPAPGRDDVDRITGQAGLILDTWPRGAVGAWRDGSSCARAWGNATRGRRPCTFGAGPSSCTRDTGSSRRRASGHGPRACGPGSGDNQAGGEQVRDSFGSAAGRG
jgi:hypothetical protein